MSTSDLVRPRTAEGLLVTVDAHGPLARVPRLRRTFRLGAVELAMLRAADGTRTMAELRSAFAGRLTGHQVEQLLLLLEHSGLLEGPEPATRRRRDLTHLRVASFPTYRLLRRGTATRVACVALAAGTAVGLVLTVATLRHHGAEAYDALLRHTYLSWSTLASYLAAVTVVGAVHELAHAVVIVDGGGTVFESGFMLNYFNPAFYVDVTGIDRIASRSRRIMVWGAGIAAQTALLGPCLWWMLVKDPPAGVAHFLLVLNAVNVAILLINSLFFIRMDGYFLLSELLGVRDLEQRGRAATAPAGRDRRVAAWTVSERTVYAAVGVMLVAYLPILVVNGVIFVLVHWLHVDQAPIDRWGLVTLPLGATAAAVVALARRTRRRGLVAGVRRG